MATITVRNLPYDVKEALRVMAAQNGVSLEAYVRRILKRESTQNAPERPDLAALALDYFGSAHGIALDLPPRGSHRDARRLFDES